MSSLFICGPSAQNYDAEQMLNKLSGCTPQMELCVVLQYTMFLALGHSYAISSTESSFPHELLHLLRPQIQIPSTTQPSSFLSGILPLPPLPYLLSPSLPALPCYHRSQALPHIVHLSCKGFGGHFPLSSALTGPRLTGSASQDARLSSEAPGSGQYRPTFCRDNITVTFRVCLPPIVPPPLPVRLHFIGREPKAKEGKSHSKSPSQVSEDQN